MLWMKLRRQEKEQRNHRRSIEILWKKDIQKATDDAVKKIDSMTAEKEKELLTV